MLNCGLTASALVTTALRLSGFCARLRYVVNDGLTGCCEA